MKRRERGFDTEWRAFLNPRGLERHLPAEIRARVLARGRAIIAAGDVVATSPLREVHAPVRLTAPARRVHAAVGISLVALVALAAGTVGAVLALHARQDQAPPPTGQQQVPLLGRPVGTTAPSSRAAAPAAAAKQALTVRSTRRRRVAGDADLWTAELALLQRAHDAYTRHEFSTAVALVGEHARRFPTGRLAEEREALRVRSLLGSGRSEEARQAAAAFAVRFPRSVLLPRADDGQKAPE